MERQERAPAPARRGRRRRRRGSTRTRLLVGIGVVLVGAWLAFAALQLVHARREALTGIDQLEALRSTMSVDSIDRGDDTAGLTRANAHFRRAHAHTKSAALTPLRALPVVGRQIRSVDALTNAATDVTAIAAARLEDARALLETAPVDRAGRVPFVQRIGALAQRADGDLATVQLGPDDGLVGPLRHARDRFADELGSLRDSADHIGASTEAVSALLQGPRTYLLLAANNAEMRVGSGAFLSIGVLSTGDGSLHLGPIEQALNYNLPDDRVPLAGDMAATWGWLQPNREWRNLASSPRFDANAQLAAQMWKASTGQDVDGVLAIDIAALKGLLAATGPVEVDGVEIDAGNVLDQVMLQQYVRAAPVGEDARREELSAVASAVVDKLERGPWSARTLASRLVDIAAGRHLLLWSQHPQEQRGWEAVDVAGRLQPDSLLLGLHNRGGNKLDQFLDVHASIDTRPVTKGTRVTVNVRLRNNATEDLPLKVAGPFKNAVGAAEGRYQGILVLELPGAARDARVDAVPDLVAAGRDGENQVIAAYIELDRGNVVDRTITFVLPGRDGQMRVEPSARVPGVGWSMAGVEWADTKPRTVTW
jgi:hypothetical protein